MPTLVEQVLSVKGHHVWSVAPDAEVREAVSMFGTHEIGAVLVCEPERLLGLLSERDCVRKILWERRCSLESSVRSVMRTDIQPVGPGDSIEHCMMLMTKLRTRHLPVMERGLATGMISIGDVINALLHDKECLIESLESYISGSPSVRPPAH